MNPSNSICSVFIGHAARLLHAAVPSNCLRFMAGIAIVIGSCGAAPFLIAQDIDDCTQACAPNATSTISTTSDPSKCSTLPAGATDIKIGPYEDVVDGPVNLLYPVDTSTDDWYVDNPQLFPCPSIGGTAPARNDPTVEGVPDPAAVNAEAEKLAAQLPGFLHFSGPFPAMVPPNYVYPEALLKQTSCEDLRFLREHEEFCIALTNSPFHGKDIIYVHGVEGDVLIDVVLNGTQFPAWPNDPNFASYWQAQAYGYWYDHIQNFLEYRNGVFRNAENRYITVGWSSAQGLETGANAVLNQIADAMVNGNGVNLTDPSDPRQTVGFCVAGCIVISHSTGAPLTDVAMSFAADPVYRQQQGTGPIGFIPKHMRVHAALGGAISGSQLATTTMVLAYGLSNSGAMCTIAGLALKLPSGQLCDSFYLLQNSVLWDLVPQVMQTQWSSRINDTPVPVLTVAGAHEELNWPIKYFFERGFDDGYVTMDSACGRTVPVGLWPSGLFSSGLNLVDPRLIDWGMVSAYHPGRYFGEQNYEFLFSAPGADLIPRAAVACAPSKTPWGMLEPIVPYVRIFNPLVYYHDHYSFLQTGEDHLDLLYRTDAPRWDSRAVLDASIYTTNVGGIALGLVRDALKTAQVQRHRGWPVKFKLFGVQHTWWIWKRTYHLLNGIDGLSTDQLAAADYVYDYVN